MGTPGPSAEVTLEDALGVFARLDRPCTPLTATEVAEELECTRRTAHRKLEELSDRGDLHTKKTGARSRVWWRPIDADPFDAVDLEADDAGNRSTMEQFGAFVNTVKDYAIFMLDPDGVVVSWNEGAKRIKGYEEDEIVGEHFSVFYRETDAERGVPADVLATAREEGRVEREGWRVRADGTEFWADVTVTAVRDAEGDLAGFTKVTRDLTERREYEEAIEAERDLLERTLDASQVGIIITDADGEAVRINDGAAEIIDLPDEAAREAYTPGERRLYDEDGRPVESHPFERVLETGEPVYDELLQLERPDGSRRWLSVNAVPLTNDDGGVEGAVSTGDDITELVESERRLRREHSQTEELLRTVPVPVAVQGADGEVIMANQRAQDALGLSEEEFIEGPEDPEAWTLYDAHGDVIGPDEVPSAIARETGEPVFDEVIAVERPDGVRKWFSMNAAPVFDAAGDLHRVVAAAEDVTDLHERARALETELGEILGRVSDAFYALDGEWRFTHVNERAEEYLQRSEDELLGEVVWEAFPETVGGPIEEHYREAMATQEAVSFELFYEPLDGWFELTAYPSETGLSVYFQDVTERKERERALEESEQRYRALVENFPNGAVALVDRDLNYRTVGGTPIDVAGTSAGDLEGEPVSEALTPELAAELVPRYEAALDGESDQFELELGGRVYQIQFVPVRDDAGDVFAALGMSQDVTDGKRRERELERFRTIVETVNDGVYTVDEEGRFTMVNEAYAELTGYDPEELVGEHVSLVINDDVAGSARQLEGKLLTGEARTAKLEAEVMTADGGTVTAEATFAMLPDEAGEAERVGVVRDISERKAYERALEESERRYRTLVENFPNGLVALFDEDLRYTAAGGELIDEAGIDLKKAIGASIHERFPPDLLREVEPYFRAAIEGEESSFEVEYLDRRLEVHTLPVRNAAGDTFAGMVVVQNITERVEREREIEEQRERYRRLVDVAPVAIVTYDADGEILFANDAAAELVGVERPAELLGTTALEYIHPDEREEAGERVRRMLEDRTEVPPNETRIRTADGGVRHVLVTSVPITADGSPAAQTVLADITEQKEREQALQRYKTVFDTIDDGVYVLDEDFRFVEVNESYAEMAGRCPEELVGEHCSVTIDADISARAEGLVGEMVRGEREGATLEGDLVTPDGERVPSEAKFTALTSEGEYRGSVGVVRDLTERKAYERALETRARQQNVVADLGQRALESPPLEELFREAVEVVSDTLGTDYCKVLELFPEDGELLLRAGVGWRDGLVGEATVGTGDDSQAGHTIRSERPIVVEDLATESRFGGPPLLVEHGVTSGISTIIGPASDPWGVLGTHDTDRREFSEQDVTFVKSVANVLTTAIERARYEERLNETVAELKESNERLEQFAYIASHDLQEPLRMISNYLRLLEDRYYDELDGDAREFIDFAVDGAERMREMIDDLLAYSRVESNAEPFEPVDADAVVRDVLEDHRLRIEETDAEVTVGDLPEVVADRKQLAQVFGNLVSNALKYRGEEPPRIEIDAERGDGEWVFTVADQGIGIDPAHADRIFEVFRRLHTREEYPGTGIGLALCKKIVERHGGRIRVDSAEGEGATFRFTIPFRGEDD